MSFWHKIIKRKNLRYASFLVLTTTLVVSFQNCGQGFISEGGAEFASQSSVAPTIVATNTPLPVTNIRDIAVSISVEANKFSDVSKLTCGLDAQSVVDCGQVFSAQNLMDGDHFLNIVATDSRSNVSSPFTVRWTVDATKPVLVINQAPPAVSGSANVSIAFSATDNLTGVATLECSYNAAAYAKCTSPVAYNNLPEGNYTLKVRGFDVAGNMSNEVTAAWQVDLTAPTVVIASGPSPLSATRAATFVFSGTDNGQALTSFMCSIDAGAFVACTSPMSYAALVDGAHTFSLKALDLAGNPSSAVSRAWTVDATLPTITLVSNPSTPTNLTSATFQFTPADNTGGSGILRSECSLNGGAFAACVSPVTYTGLANGNRSFGVRAVDNAGNLSAAVNFSWVIDGVPPTISVSASVSNSTTSTSAVMTITAADPGSGLKPLECKIDAGAYAACTSPVSYSGLAVGSHTFTARATDNAGNQNTAAFAWTITTVTTPPPATSDVTLAWDAVTQNDDGTAGTVKGYKLRYGLASNNYSATISETVIGNVTTYKVPALESGKNYYFVVTAVDTAGVESSNSNEFIYTVP